VVVLVCVGVVACHSTSEAERLERITLGPRKASRTIGEAQRFTATGHYAGGATRNLTQRVEYTSSDPAVAKALNAQGDRSRIDTVAPGTATITATDPRTGISSRTTGGDATLTVLGALERITLSPSMITRNVGQTQRLTATGYYAGGTTRNLTQRLVYRSSNPEVAAAPNAAGDKSRIEVVGTGSATISARDPASGISSSTAGGDATVIVVPPKPGS
jgi:uncharacterized protein YjdB